TQNVAHELKTPVSSIQGFLDILIADDNLPEEQKQDFLKRSHAQATRLANILRDISMLTRIDDVPTGFEKTDCNLHEIVDNVATDLASNLQKHGDIVQNNIPADCTLQGNYSLLYSIFRNLVDNSIAYAGENITITVETSSTVNSQQSIIEVIYADNGKGIPEQHLPYIFERFYRVDKGRSRSMGGTGLGLAIVKHAVILHDSHIEAIQAPNGGLQFNFTLKR
ncbi:MAG: two-component sensor histidine kinase, partial [Bacteroidaceae bacterium]|nr:two-component sensor histidine kinase [Bacteroidaceae bacterium]